MRALSKLMLVAALTLPLAACDKKDEGKKDAKTDDKAKADDGKAEAKKEGEVVGANAVGTTESVARDGGAESGCLHGEEKHAEGEGCDHGAGAPAPEATGHFGNPFVLADAKPLATVLASGVGTDAVKVTGTVESVCQAKGCWMVIKDGEMQARVMVKDHAFAIPMDGKGKAAVVEGTITTKELTQANIDHLKKDGDPSVGDVPKTEYFLEATAVELANS